MNPGQVVDVKFAPVSDNLTVSKGRGMVTEDVLGAASRVADGVELGPVLVALNSGTGEIVVSTVGCVVKSVGIVVKSVAKLLSSTLPMLLSWPSAS